MSQPSPSLLNSLRRFQYQKKNNFQHDNSVKVEEKLQSQDESLDPVDSDYGSTVGSSGDTGWSEESIIKPLRLKPFNQLSSESSSQNLVQNNVDIKKLTQIDIEEIRTKMKHKFASTAHSISDSDEEDCKKEVITESKPESVPGEEEDDDDVVLFIPRSRTPKPIIVSDDEDECLTPNAPMNEDLKCNYTGAQENCLKQEIKTEEPEIFIVDDDSNSVEIIQSDFDTKTEVKQDIKPNNVHEVSEDDKKRKAPSESPRPKAKRKRRKKRNSDSEDDHIRGEKVFDSDADSDEEISDYLTESKRKVLDFLNTATEGELRIVPSCTVKKIEAIQSMRPFEGWIDLVTKFQTGKFLGTNLLNGAQQVIEAREVVAHLMRKCERIATRTEKAIAAGSHSISCQPSILNPELKLMTYQMVGLNWLNVMNSQRLSGILADEMGLGKTIQVIAFLAHLKETGQTTPNSPHLIVVPASTLENWCIEFEKWCPALKVEQYYGSPDERRALRHTWVKNGFDDIDVVLTTYSMVGSCYEERKMFRVVNLHYVIFDEAHMLKNMNTQRYENLITINALHRTLLTGTPLQNNLLELMSLLVFVMPDMFSGKTDYLKFLFSKNSKQNIEEAPLFEQEQVQRAKRIMHPFVLRRLKVDVLRDLPTKTTRIVECPLEEEEQAIKYTELCDSARNDDGHMVNSMTIMMDLRRMANHPLTLRYHYQDDTLSQMAEILASEPTHKEKDATRVLEDLQWMSDHQLHRMVVSYDCLRGFELADSVLVRSGKFLKLDEILPPLKAGGHRVLIFSQFVFILDILEDYMRVRNHSFLRLDGSTPVTERQDMIDLYNQDSSIFVFLLSTKAGGIGINLTAADTVIIHDVDFNPYNDKQAEDRCHRMGQTRPVQIMRFVSKDTIEEAILRIAQEKLHLEKEVTSYKDDEVTENINVAQLLRDCLGISEAS
uniref:SWI/SNF-related matrix-associated actin-dependent regulator of chromatin subfamily A containing DEAD/H box 1 homolog n=1 Tax=Homalodisca liturata TaxID=320908 RepID=A0A1B6HJ59_9HEMI